ncbi:MAG: hypothetical protein HQK79_00990 [Desulfobacterales bacterium]|nr:hypothetical protein [Desulfobacterales bacterium]
MATREKIIIILMIAVLGYGGFSYLVPSKDVALDFTKKVEEAKQFASTFSTALASAQIPETDKHLISKASIEWVKDPLLSIPLPVETKKKPDDQAKLQQMAKFIFSGFLNFGGRSLAVINGIEYEAGDEILNQPGYIVRRISPNQVEIGIRDEDENITIPLEEKSILPSGKQ